MPPNLGALHAALEHPARDGEVAAEFQSVWEEADGLYASWTVPATPAGDRLLAEFRAGTRTGISVELEPWTAANGQLTGGVLDAVAFPVRPAFDSARLAASYVPDTTTEPAAPAAALVRPVQLVPAGAGMPAPSGPLFAGGSVTADDLQAAAQAYAYLTLNEYATADEVAAAVLSAAGITLPDGVDDPLDDTSTTDTSGDAVPHDPLTASRAAAAATAGRANRLSPVNGGLPLPAGAPGAAGPAPRRRRGANERLTAENASPQDVYALLAGVAGGDRRLMAALADITMTNITDTSQPAWLGELWKGVRYTRKVWPLFNSAPLTSLRMTGWRWVDKPVMDDYAGDKAAVPSNEIALDTFNFTGKRLAGAHDIDRAITDFGDTGFLTAYYEAMTDSYAMLTDAKASAAAVTSATAFTPGVVPDGVSPGTALIVDGALAMIETTMPTFALVAPDVYRSVILTPQETRLAFLTQSAGLREGAVESFPVIPVPSLAAGHALVGAREAMTVYELGGGTPIRADALNIAQGGEDHGVFGYWATVTHQAKALQYGALAGTPAS